MSTASKINAIMPQFAVPGGEIEIEAEGFRALAYEGKCFIGNIKCRVVAASSRRILVEVPEGAEGKTEIFLQNGQDRSEPVEFNIGKKLAEDMHIVANPAIDPKDNSIIVTLSGSRGHKLPDTLFRIETDGYVAALPVEIMNPTGVAFSPSGELFASNRSNGAVYRIDRNEEAVPFITGLGIATGIAFNQNGEMFVGDRSGKIYRVSDFGTAEVMAELEPSVAAYHLAFGADSRLYVTAPGLASHDSIYAIDIDGNVERYARGFGRPQGLAFDNEGNLYVAACYKSRRGIIKVPAEGDPEWFASGNGLVGLCFNRKGEMIVATNSTVYSLNTSIRGNLL